MLIQTFQAKHLQRSRKSQSEQECEKISRTLSCHKICLDWQTVSMDQSSNMLEKKLDTAERRLEYLI